MKAFVKVVSVKENSVRLRVDSMLVDLKVTNENGKYRVSKPRDVWFDDFTVIVAKVLDAYVHGKID